MYKHVSHQDLLEVNQLVRALSRCCCVDQVTGEEVDAFFTAPYSEFSLAVQSDDYSKAAGALSTIVETGERMLMNPRTALDEMTSEALRAITDTCRRVLAEMSSRPV